MKPFKPCNICTNAPFLDIKPPEGYFHIDKGEGYITLKECECLKKWMRENLMYIRAGKANLWVNDEAIEYDPVKDHVGNKDIDNIHMLRQHLSYLISGKCFYITGGFSTQKTTLAQWIGLETFRQGYTAYYENMHNFITHLVPMGFNDLDKHKDYYDKILAVDVLILDNVFDKMRTNIQSFQLPYIESTLRDRIEGKKKAVVFVTGLEISKELAISSLNSFIGKVTNGNELVLHDSTTAIKIDNIFGKR